MGVLGEAKAANHTTYDGAAANIFVIAGHSPSKTGVNALTTQRSIEKSGADI